MRWLLLGGLLACAPPPEPLPPAPPSPPAIAAAAPAPAPPPPPEPAEPILERRLRAHVEALVALNGREAGTDDEVAAAGYVAEQLEGMEIAAPERGRVETFPIRVRDRGNAERTSRNVYGLLPGARDDWVVVGAHIDHVGVRDGKLYPGAEDNASGVAAVLEVGRALAGTTLDRPVLLAFFGGEEVGLWGSKHLAAKPMAPVSIMVNVDMIGRKVVDSPGLGMLKPLVGLDDDDSVGMIGTAGRPWLRTLVDGALATEALTGWAPEDLPGPLEKMANAIARNRADDAPFSRKGIPTVFFSAGESADYHEPTDTTDRLELPLMARRTRAIAALVQALSSASIPKGTEAAPP